MSDGSLLQVVTLTALLVLVASAYASYRLEWRMMVRQGFIWAAMFAGLTLLISLMGG